MAATVLWLLAAALGARFIVFALDLADRPAVGFVAHYTASRLLLDGRNAATLYTDGMFRFAVREYEPTVSDIFGANPPTVALTAVPLALLDYGDARFLWTMLTAVLWIAAAMWLGRTLRLGVPWFAAFACLALAFEPAWANVRHAQMHVLALWLVLGAWHAWRMRRPLPAGAAVGTLLAAKATGFAFWPMFIAQRNVRALLAGLGAAAGFSLIATITLGPDAWSLFFDRARELSNSGSLTVTAYQSVVSLVRRLTMFDARWNPDPLLRLGAVGIVLSWVAVLALVGVSMWLAGRRSDDAMFAAFAALGLAISPVSMDTHYAVAILPIAVLLARYQSGMASLRGVVLAAAALMIALDLPYRSPIVGSGILALLAYPKLYGALLLWGLCLESTTEEKAG